MRIKEAAKVVFSALRRSRPVILTSGPGVGKTSLVEAVSEQLAHNLHVTYPVFWDITDPKGLPMPVPGEDYAVFMPFGEVKQILDATEPTIWFFDDFTQTSEEVQAALMPLFLKRTIGGRKIPDCVRLALAGNRVEDGSAVVPMLDALKNRMAAFVNVEPHIADWCEWAMTKGGLEPEVVAFLRLRPKYLYDFYATSEMQGFASPRAWEEVNKWYVEQKCAETRLDNDIFQEVIASIVGAEKASEFLAFTAHFKTLNILDKCLVSPETVVLPTAPDALYALSAAIASHVTSTTFPNVVKLAYRLHEMAQGDAGVLMVQLCIREKPELAQTTGYVDFSTSEVGQLQLV